MAQQITLFSTGGSLIVVEYGVGIVAAFSVQQLRLLRALAAAGGRLPKRTSTRAMCPDHDGALTPSHRSSAARSISRLEGYAMVSRKRDSIVLDDPGRRYLEDQR